MKILRAIFNDGILVAMIIAWAVVLTASYLQGGWKMLLSYSILCMGYFMGLYVAAKIINADHGPFLGILGFMVAFIAFPFMVILVLAFFAAMFNFSCN